MGGFSRDARKAENGFVPGRIVSSRERRRNNPRKTSIISVGGDDGLNRPGHDLGLRRSSYASSPRRQPFTRILRISVETGRDEPGAYHSRPKPFGNRQAGSP